jgi:hypothetical protein
MYLCVILFNLDIRVNLLEPRKNSYLVKSLFGILLMLPQGKAYQALFRRLRHVEVIYKLDKLGIIEPSNLEYSKEEIDNYLQIFEETNGNLIH